MDQKAAFRAYQNLLEGMLEDKQITPEAYAGAQRLFSRANTVAEKTARARRRLRSGRRRRLGWAWQMKLYTRHCSKGGIIRAGSEKGKRASN